MTTSLLLLAALLLGVFLGAASLVLAQRQQKQRDRWAQMEEPAMEAGAADVLALVGRAYVVVDGVDGVVQASSGAYALGLVRGHSILLPEMAQMVSEVRQKGVIMEGEVEVRRSAQTQEALIIDFRVAPLGDELIVVLADDRTEIVRAQRVRTDFVANVSHELKTPVGAIGLMAEAIETAADDPQAVLYFSGKLKQESKRLGALVQDVIELSRLQSTDLVLSATLLDLSQVAQEALERSRLVAEDKSIQLTLEGQLDRPVHGDRDLLGTAIHNLIENAIRYSPENTRVQVTLGQLGDQARLEVKDQGPGIPPEDLDRIFERFYRVDPARSRQTGGTGLGLSIVRHILAQHGGQVLVESQLGEGSSFTLLLPLVDQESEADLLAELASTEPVSNGSS